jgi:GntR family transcriptional regulator, transcriptional repressor for pyruvate dehydrogenase complex
VTVTSVAIEKIKEMILSGAVQPGERLPKEDELAARLGLSRSSLREAVRALALVRILDVRQGDGTYVTSLDPELLLDAVSFVVDFHRDDSVFHFLGVRRILEPAATAMAAQRATPEQVARLRDIVAGLDPSATVEQLVATDLVFHREIASCCENPVLASLLDSISAPLQRARIWRGRADELALEQTMSEHVAIVDAIERQEPDVAAARAVAHIAGVEDWLRRVR